MNKDINLQESEKNDSDNSEKILIITAIIMFAILIGYNAFFVPPVSENIQISGDIVKNQDTSDEENKKEDTENEKNKSGLININTASKDELTELTGVGPKIAERIIEYRKSVGRFTKTEEIKNVTGIGDKTFESIRDYITV